MVGCAPDNVKMLLFSHFVCVLKIRDVDASNMENPIPQSDMENPIPQWRTLYLNGEPYTSMENPIPQYNILNKYICNNRKDYVGFFYPGIVFSYTIYLFPFIPYS